MKIKKTNKALLLTAIVAGVFILVLLIAKKTSRNIDLYSEVHTVKNGYGYTIKNDEKILIKQNFIPAVEGEKVFNTEKDAKKVADFVVEKIKMQASPVVTIEDLKKLNISL